VERLCWRLRTDSVDDLKKNLEASLAEKIAQSEVEREPCWTDSLIAGFTASGLFGKNLILFCKDTSITLTSFGATILRVTPATEGPNGPNENHDVANHRDNRTNKNGIISPVAVDGTTLQCWNGKSPSRNKHQAESRPQKSAHRLHCRTQRSATGASRR
jgi:hypothetical protein